MTHPSKEWIKGAQINCLIIISVQNAFLNFHLIQKYFHIYIISKLQRVELELIFFSLQLV